MLPHTDKPQGRAEVARQLTAEKEISQFEVGKGMTTKWVQTFSRNHLLDACYMSFVGLSVLQWQADLAERKRNQQSAGQVISGRKASRFVGSAR